jgi:type II secretion system protein H
MSLRRRSARGFTLVELILVMVVLLAVTAVVAPRFSDSFPSLQVRKSADRIFAWARKARADAAETGARHRLVLEPERRAFWIEREAKPLKEPGKFTPLGGAWEEETLPPEVVLAVAEGLETDPSNSKRRYAEFLPDGTATGGTVEVSHEKGDRRQVKIVAATSGISVLNPAEAP